MSITAYIALGSNMADSLQTLLAAVEAIGALESCSVSKVSSWYSNPAVGPVEQEDFINGVLELQTTLLPEQLLDQLQTIENNFGRVRDIHWGPRTLDLDIILYGNEVVNTARLTVPHAEMLNRNFVLYPLYEVNSDLILPKGQALSTLLASVSNADLTLVKAGAKSTP